MNPIRSMTMALLTFGGVTACDQTAKGPEIGKAPYAERVIQTHAIDYRICFPETPLEDTAPPPLQEAGAGGQDALVAIDSSGSMAARLGGQTKMEIAKAAVEAFVQGMPAQARIGLVVFGHAGANTAAAKATSCGAGAQVLTAPTTDRAQMSAALASVRPVGWTPLAAAIQSASQNLSGLGARPRVLYIVSDGLETCGGDPVAQASAANQAAQKVIVNVIAFGAPTAEQATLQAVAAAGGGSFVVAEDAATLRDALRSAAQSSLRGYFTDTAVTRGHNVVVVGSAVSKATQCIRTTVDKERLSAMIAIDADEKAGRATDEEASAARSVMNKRGDAALKALVAYSEALQAAEKAQADTLWARFRATESGLQSKPAP